MDITSIIFFSVFIVICLIIYYIQWRNDKRRREALLNWAQSHGWSYNDHRDQQTYDRYSFLNGLQRGKNRYTFDNLHGRWDGYPAEAFNFHYSTTSSDSEGNRKTHHHYLGVVLIQIERSFPKLVIYPEDSFQKLINAFGFGDIKFESVEFSRKFTVDCSDKKFAYDFCNTKMIEYLLMRSDIDIELDENIIALYHNSGTIDDPEKIQEYLIKLCQLRQLMPKYLFNN
jgi:hypothetical protein